MNTRSQFEVWRQVEIRLKQQVASLRHARFYKLGKEGKRDVLQGAALRLLKPDAVFPYALRKRLAPRPLVADGAPVGWIGNWRPIDSTLWEAWLTVHTRYFERGDFWFEGSAAHDELIDLAIDAERIAYCATTSDVGGTGSDGKLVPELLETVARLTGSGQQFRDGALREALNLAQLGAEDAALRERGRLDAEENTRLRHAINADPWMRKRPQNQREALNLILFEPTLRGCDIAVRCGVAESTVSKIRAKLEELADKILTIPAERGRAVSEEEVREFYEAHVGRILQPYESVAATIREYLSCQGDANPDPTLDVDASSHDEPELLGAAEELDRNKNPKALDGMLSGFGTIQDPLHSWNVDDPSENSENVANSHARMKANERLLGGVGRRTISDSAMERGYENRRETYKERVCAWRVRGVKQEKSIKRFANTAERYLRQKDERAVDAIFNYLETHVDHCCLSLLDRKIEQKGNEIGTALAELADLKAQRQMQVAEALRCSLVANQSLLRAWAAPQFEDVGASLDEVLGPCIVDPKRSADDVVAGTIGGPEASTSAPTSIKHEENGPETAT